MLTFNAIVKFRTDLRVAHFFSKSLNADKRDVSTQVARDFKAMARSVSSITIVNQH